jgi:hypothetical protein
MEILFKNVQFIFMKILRPRVVSTVFMGVCNVFSLGIPLVAYSATLFGICRLILSIKMEILLQANAKISVWNIWKIIV